MRIRIDPSQVKKDTEEGLGGADGKAAGEKAGKSYGEGFKRGADGKLRDAKGKFVTDAEAAKQGDQAGRTFGERFGARARAEINKQLAGIRGPGTAVGLKPGLIGTGVGVGGALLPALLAASGVGLVGLAGLGVAGIGAKTLIGSGTQAQVTAAQTALAKLQTSKSATPAQIALAQQKVTTAQAAVGPLSAPAQLIGKTFTASLKDAAGGILPAMRQVFGQIPGILRSITPLMKDVFSAAGGLLEPLLMGLSSLAKVALPLFASALRVTAPLFGPLLGGFTQLLAGLLPGLIGLLKAAGPAVSALAGFLGTLGKAAGLLLGALAPGVAGSAVALKAVGALVQLLAPLLGVVATQLAIALAPAFAALATALVTLTPSLVTLVTVIGTGLAFAVKYGAIGLQVIVDLAARLPGPVKLAALAIVALGVAMKLAALGNPWVLLGTAIVIAVGLIVTHTALLKHVWEDIATFFVGLWHDITGAFDKGVAFVDSLIHNKWFQLGVAIVNPFAAAALLLATHWRQVWGEIQRLPGQVLGGLTSLLSGPLGAFNRWWSQNGAAVTAVWSAVWGGLVAVAAPILQFIAGQASAFWRLLSAVFSGGVRLIEIMWDTLFSGLSIVAQTAWRLIEIGLTAFWRAWSAVWNTFTGSVAAVWHLMWTVVFNAAKVIWAAVVAIVKIGWDVMVGIFTIALDLVTGRWGKAWQTVQTVFQQVWNAIRQFLGTVLASVLDVLNTAWGTVERLLTLAWDGIRKWWDAWWTGLFDSFKTATDGIIRLLSDVWRGIAATAKDAWNTLKGVIGAVWAGVRAAISAPLKVVVDLVWNPFASAVDAVAGFFHLGHPVPTINTRGWATGGSPGRIFAGTSGTADDVHVRVSRGETIISAAHSRILSPVLAAVGVPGYASGGVIGGIGGFLGGIGSSILNFLVPKPVRDALGLLTGNLLGKVPSGGGFTGLIHGIFGSLLGGAGHWITTTIKSLILGGGGTGSAGNVPGGGLVVSGAAAAAQSFARTLVAAMWPNNAAANFGALRTLWNGESGWRWNALNPSSGAYGIPQSLPADKMASAGADWRTNPGTQIRWGLGYINSVYGSPAAALGAWLSRSPHWYGNGGAITEPVMGIGLRSGDSYGFGENGIEDVVPRGRGGGRGGGRDVSINLGGVVIREEADVSLLASKLGFAMTAEGSL